MVTVKMCKKMGWFVIASVLALLVISGTYLFAYEKAAKDIRADGNRQLEVIAHDLASILNKFDTLPFTVGFIAGVGEVLQSPENETAVRALNLTLQAIQRQSRVYAIYLMDANGKTLASSNWNQPLSFVGKQFDYRPYFRSAIKGETGRFYGIGSLTHEPGYFIAQPVYPSGAVPGKTAPIGVVAVKIDLTEFEETWRSSEEPMALADRSGVVFLSNRKDWKYRSLRPLDPAVQQSLAQTLQYANRNIVPIEELTDAGHNRFGSYVVRPVGPLGWQLMWFPSEARVTRIALVWVLTVTLLVAIVCVSIWAMYQRRRRLEEGLLSRSALQQAAEDLERKIVQRTEDLLTANQGIESRYAKLQETEHLLRSTQNELVQAGKLAMLGQMAAGVTHELNQPLAAIQAFADNAITFLARGQPDRARENLSHISAACARMGAIIQQLKGFARKSHDAVAIVDLAKSIELSALLLQNDFMHADVRLNIEIRDRLQVLGDALRAEQVLINLMRNALDAVKDTKKRVVTVILECEGEQAVVRIRDSGAGIPTSVAPHLFEAFFTTKPPGQGLGLGLAISSSIVQAMNGQLSAHNHEEGGAEFLLRLPLPAMEPVTA